MTQDDCAVTLHQVDVLLTFNVVNMRTCTTSNNTTLDSTDLGVAFTSIAIGTNGVPIISYRDATSGDLKVAFAWWLAGGR